MSERAFPSRRSFLKSAVATGVAGPLILSQGRSAGARNSANDRVQLGFIGVGVQGGGHVRSFLRSPQVQVVAICDVVRERKEFHQKAVEDYYAQDKKGTFKGCQVYGDFRALLDNKDIDAVLIATPDHWHAITCISAAKAHKDIYSEKPLTLNVAEGRKVVDAVAAGKVIFQTGSQQRSEYAGRFRKAVELVRNGCIGEVKTVPLAWVGRPLLAICRRSQFPTGPIGISGRARRLCEATTKFSVPRVSTSTSPPGGLIGNMAVAASQTWGPITSTSRNGPWVWTEADRSRLLLPRIPR